jgi:4-amino-4-deoxy-L-arabinose transferase-like glycosyltransferase
MLIVWCVLAVYAIGFAFFYPVALTNYDEVSYLRQAATFAAGSTTVDTIDPATGLHRKVHPSDYPPGTSALMTPFVWIVGWRGAFLLGLVALLAAVLFTAKWISDAGGSPLFALIVLAYPPTLVIARTAMSDVPSAALVAAGLWLFWPANGSTWRRLAAGFIAGVSLCLREPNAILFAFFFAGALFRRERRVAALVIGGLAGVICRLLSVWIVYGDPLYAKNHGYGFTGLFAQQNLLMYLAALLLMVPGGLISAILYRGRRWPELVSTALGFTLVFVLWNYNASPSSGLKQWVLAPRFFIPLLPILAFAMAQTIPRWWERFLKFLSFERRQTWEALGNAIVVIWLAAVAVLCFAANWRAATWDDSHNQVVRTLYSHVDPTHPILTDIPATVKFLNELHGSRIEGNLEDMSDDDIRRAVERYGGMEVVFFDRDDSPYWTNKARQNQILIEELAKRYRAKLSVKEQFQGLGVLQIWSIASGS